MVDQNTSAPKFDPDNPLPYGGMTDIYGNIIWAVTKEEHAEMLARVRKAFRSNR